MKISRDWTTIALTGVMLAAGTFACPDTAAAQERDEARRVDRGEVRSRVVGLLRTIERLPDREAFERAAERPEAVLWWIVDAEKIARPVRTAALDALARYWPSRRVVGRLTDGIEADATSLVDRVEYVSILGRCALEKRAARLLEDYLAGRRHLQVRLAAVSALGQMETDQADHILRARLEAGVEHELVGERIASSLEQ